MVTMGRHLAPTESRFIRPDLGHVDNPARGVEIGHERMPEEMEEFWSTHAAGPEVGYVTNVVWSRP
jgi:hypothetical protein